MQAQPSAPVTPPPVDSGAVDDLPAWAREHPTGLATADVVVRFALATIFTPLFIAFAIAFGLIQFVILVILLLVVIAGVGSGARVLSRFPALDRIKVLGGVLRVSRDLDLFYRENQPRGFLWYAFYPLYALIGSIVSKTVRREVGLHLQVLLVVVVILVFELIAGYGNTFPPHLGPLEALQLLGLELLVVVLLASQYLMPMVTTVYTLNLSGRRVALRVMVGVSLLLTAPIAWGTWRATKGDVPLFQTRTLNARLGHSAFRKDLLDLVRMFLPHAREQRWIGKLDEVPRILPEPTRRFRVFAQGLAPNQEPRAFDVLGLKIDGEGWLGLRVRFGRSAFLLYMMGPDGEIVDHWTELPAGVRGAFRRGLVPNEQRNADRADASSKELRAQDLVVLGLAAETVKTVD